MTLETSVLSILAVVIATMYVMSKLDKKDLAHTKLQTILLSTHKGILCKT